MQNDTVMAGMGENVLVVSTVSVGNINLLFCSIGCVSVMIIRLACTFTPGKE